MGKSYKKFPVIKDNGKGKKTDKKIASKITRAKLKNSDESCKGNAYKKQYESYKIADYTCHWTKEEALKDYHNPNSIQNWKEEFPTEEEFLNFWEKCMRRK